MLHDSVCKDHQGSVVGVSCPLGKGSGVMCSQRSESYLEQRSGFSPAASRICPCLSIRLGAGEFARSWVCRGLQTAHSLTHAPTPLLEPTSLSLPAKEYPSRQSKWLLSCAILAGERHMGVFRRDLWES